MAFNQSLPMPPARDAAKRLLRMAVEKARLYYYKNRSPNPQQLQSLSGSEFECVGDVKGVDFDREAIEFSQSKKRDSAMVQLATEDYTLQSVTVEKPFEPVHWGNVETVMVLHIVCHRRPERVYTLYPLDKGMPVDSALPLAKYASQMHFIRIEFGEICSWWKVSRPTKGSTIAAVKTKLEQLFALYIASTSYEPVLHSTGTHAMTFHLSSKYKLHPTSGYEASPWSEAESSAAANPAHPSSSSGHPPEFPYFTSPSPPTSRALTSTLLHQTSPTSTILQHPGVLKQKLDEMIVHYDKIEEEEKKSMASCHEKKEKLWADWRSTDPPTPANPQHPAGLKRKLEEMEVKYNRIEDEEKEVTVRCHEKKEKLWEDLSKGIPLGHRDGNDRERQRA